VTSGPVGVIEGFYGPPWSWEARREVAVWCAERGMRDYVYAPKDDPKHRHEWRAPYDANELAGFERFAGEGALALGFAISPGLSIDCDSSDDRDALAAKVDQVVAVGAERVVLALDDIPFGGGPQGEAHARLTTWLRDHLGDRASLSLIPTEYVGTRSTSYLDALASGVPEDVPIGWTGCAVVNDSITVADAEARAASLGGRTPLLWDNYPVNDAVMGDRLFVGPLRGREPGLRGALDGYLANPMEHARASTLPLASVAALLRGDDPQEIWEQTAADLGWLAFAHACDGEQARGVVASGDRAAQRALFEEAAVCAAPGLEEEAAEWLTQIHRDARLALAALDVIDGERAVDTVLGLGVRWQASRRATKTVFGPRCSVRVLIGQADDGTWQVEPGAIEHDQNAIDALAREALAAL
jgi:hypothetical protein